MLYLDALRGVAQPGRASALGAECRQFESGYPDTQNDPLVGSFCVFSGTPEELTKSVRQNPARAKRTQPDFGLDLSAAQASPKGKTRNEMSVLAIWLPFFIQ